MSFNTGFNTTGFMAPPMDENDDTIVIGNSSMMEFEPAPISQGGRIHVVNAIDNLPQSLTHYCDDFLAVFSKQSQQSSCMSNNYVSITGQQADLDFQLDFEPEPLSNIRDDSQNSSNIGQSRSRQSGTPPLMNQSHQFSQSSYQQSNSFVQQNQMAYAMNFMMTLGNPHQSSSSNQVFELLDDNF